MAWNNNQNGYQQNRGYGAPNGQQGGQQGSQQNLQQGNGSGQPQGQQNRSNQQGGDRPYSVKVINQPGFRDTDGSFKLAPLEECTMAVLLRPGDNGDHLTINYCEGTDGKPHLRLNFSLKIGPTEVARVFGPEFKRDDNTVDFTVFLWGFNPKQMLQYPPKATQSILLLVTGMQINKFTDKHNRERIGIVGNSPTYQVFGSTKKRDGTDAKNMVIFGAENAQSTQQGQQTSGSQNQPSYSQPNSQQGFAQPGGFGSVSGIPGVTNFVELDSDDELPF